MSKRIWLGVLDSARVHRYYLALAGKLRLQNRIFSVVSGLSATGAAATLLAQLPELASAALFFTTTAALLWMLRADYAGRAAIAASVAKQSSMLHAAWKDLWYEQGDTDVASRLKSLERNLLEITNLYEGDMDEALNEKCAEVSYAVAQDEFRAA